MRFRDGDSVARPFFPRVATCGLLRLFFSCSGRCGSNQVYVLIIFVLGLSFLREPVEMRRLPTTVITLLLRFYHAAKFINSSSGVVHPRFA